MQTKRRNALILIMLVLVVLLLVGTVFAVTADYFSIKINYPAEAGTDTFTLNGNVAYYQQPVVAELDTSLNLTVNKSSGGSTDVTAFDLLVFAPAGTVGYGGNTAVVKPVIDGNWFVFENVTYTGGVSGQTVSLSLSDIGAATLKAVVVTHREYNEYINDVFELKSKGQQELYNANNTENANAYRNLYILGDIAFNEAYTINYPCYIDLLFSTLTLNADLTIKHHGRGAFEIDGIAGEAAIINDTASLVINAPLSYYRTAGIESLMSTPANFNKTSDNVDFTDATNSTLRAALLADAADYYMDNIRNRLYVDAVLPTSYHGYDVTYAFTSANTAAMSSIGRLTRAADDVNVAVSVVASLAGDAVTAAKTVCVTGTSEAALSAAFNAELEAYFFVSCSKIDVEGIQTAYMQQRIELTTFINDFIKAASPTADITISTVGSTYLGISYDGADYEKLELLYSAGVYSLSFDDGAAEALGLVDAVYLSRDQWVLDETTDDIAVTFGLLADAVTLRFNGITKAEKERYIERYIETLFFTDKTDTANLVRFSAGATYSGAESTPVIGSDLGFQSVTYNVYLISQVNLAALVEGTMTQAEVIMAGTDYGSHFVFEGGVLSIRGGDSLPLRITDSNALLLDVQMVHADNSGYRTYREIKIPANGIGGSDYAEYVGGNTFQSYFDDLDNGRLIDSTADVGAVLGTGYRFKADIGGVNLLMTINTAGISDFCTIVTSDTGVSQINIDVANVPSTNTVVQLTAVFYETGQFETPISEQFYSFVIPGVYRYAAVGGDFTDQAFYNRLLAATGLDGQPLYESFGVYLLADGARASVPELDLSLPTATPVDITGLNLLSGTARIILDNNTLLSVDALGLFEEHSLTYLSLQNCGVTDAMLAGGALRGLQTLAEIHLENNAVSSLKTSEGESVLYRTVKALYLDNQAALTNISGIELLLELTTVSLSGNNISVFNPLLGIETLEIAYIFGNTNSLIGKAGGDTNTYYGTTGLANISVYVDLLTEGVTLYIANDTTMAALSDYTADQIMSSRILNGIFVMYTQFGTISNFPSSVTASDSTVYNISVLYLIVSETVVAVSPTVVSNNVSVPASVVAGTVVHLLAGVTASGTTVYRDFEFLYEES